MTNYPCYKCVHSALEHAKPPRLHCLTKLRNAIRDCRPAVREYRRCAAMYVRLGEPTDPLLDACIRDHARAVDLYRRAQHGLRREGLFA